MAFSEFLDSRRGDCRELVKELSSHFSYVSVLGTDVKASVYRADKKSAMARDGSGECGFVVKMHDGRAFFEYSADDISGDKKDLCRKILESVSLTQSLSSAMISTDPVREEPLEKDFARENDFEEYDDSDLINVCRETSELICREDEHVLNGIAVLQFFTSSKLFVSKNKCLSQYYGWANGTVVAVYSDGRTVPARMSEGEGSLAKILCLMKEDAPKVVELARHLVKAQPIKPGLYDVITDSSITGLIAHEAFGHGVEMDQFVKDRSQAKMCVGEYVASPIASMRDGAASAESVASYFFDDDGVLAHDTKIIDKGILIAGLSDLASATQLGTDPTGNGRRDSYKRKAYSRMTNTYFEAGTDKLEDMIASVKHGYMLFETNNGMEDPKNWAIQCTAEYGIEIVDGKLTDNYVSPVVMSGYVPDLLKSISMISDNFKVIGCGSCGKGYKEWVRVSDGGPNLKVRVKLG